MPEFKLRRHRGKFCVEYVEGGRRFRRSLGTNDIAQAKVRLAEYERQFTIKQGKGPLTVAAVYQAYVADRAGDGKTTTRMHDAWKRLAPKFGPLLVEHVTKKLCQSYTASRRREGASSGTIHLELGYLRAAYAFAMKQGWMTFKPDIPLPQKPIAREGHLTKEQARAVMDAAVMPHVRLFLELAIATGARASAILDLTWDRVNFERRQINLKDPSKAATPKGRAIVPMNDRIYHRLLEAKPHALTDYVIEWGGKKVASVKKGVRLTGQRAGVPLHPHMLRHTAAVWMAEDGVSMPEIAQYLGHSDPRTTHRIYARYTPDHLRKAADALDF